ncbi:MAG: hypothetical protein AB9866_17620 [Syntrophobacteraceae bacterium]
MKAVRRFIQHNANSLHVYCRLCGYIPTPWAKKVTKLYEKSIHKLVYAI